MSSRVTTFFTVKESPARRPFVVEEVGRRARWPWAVVLGFGAAEAGDHVLGQLRPQGGLQCWPTPAANSGCGWPGALFLPFLKLRFVFVISVILNQEVNYGDDF